MAAEQLPRRLRRFQRIEEEKIQPAQEQEKKIATATQNKKTTEKTTQATAQQQEKVKIPPELLKQIQELAKKETSKESTNYASNEIKRFREKHNRLPRGEEYDEIAENIYQQVKKSEENTQQQKVKGRDRREERKIEQKTTEKTTQATIVQQPQQKETKKIDFSNFDIKNLFSEDEKELKLDDIGTSEEDELKLTEMNDNLDALPKEIETEKNNCPNCKTIAEELIFCPDCGTAFCTHCAKATSTEAGITKYVCPKCSKQVKAQK
jgi:hypothetical protein